MGHKRSGVVAYKGGVDPTVPMLWVDIALRLARQIWWNLGEAPGISPASNWLLLPGR